MILKVLCKIVREDILFFMYYFSWKIRLSILCELSEMPSLIFPEKVQEKKKIKISSAAVVISAVWVNDIN